MFRDEPKIQAMENDSVSPDLMKGEISPSMQKMVKTGFIFALIAILGIGAFALTSYFSVPFAIGVLVNAWFAGGTVYLSGITFGIINDLIATRVNLPYFTLGHRPGQKSVVESNDPNAVGIAWGILATSGLSVVAGSIFTVAALITGFVGLPFAGFILPVLGLGLPIAIGAAHWYSKKMSKKREESGELDNYRDYITSPFSPLLDPYQTEKLNVWIKTKEDTNAWFANSDRNSFGYISMPALAITGLASMITFSAVSSLLPAIFFSAAVSVFPPLALGALLAVGIAVAGVYLYHNHKKQVNNGYQLHFNNSPENKPAPDADASKEKNKTNDLMTYPKMSQHMQVNPAPQLEDHPSDVANEEAGTHKEKAVTADRSRSISMFFNEATNLATLEDKFIEEHRHDNDKLQHEYDKRHGLILR